MIVVTGVFEIAASDLEAAKTAVKAMVAETLQEDGCHVYEFSQIIGAETRFRVYEEWADLQSLEAHFKSPHMAVFRDALSRIDVKSRNVVRFEAGPKDTL